MGYTLKFYFLVILMIITDTRGLSVHISPISASVTAGDDLIVTSTIIKTDSETWESFIFYVKKDNVYTSCRGTSYSAKVSCADIFGCSYGFGFTCNYTHFNLLINNADTRILGISINAEVTLPGNSDKVISTPSTIEFKIPLQGVLLTPNGTITIRESKTEKFKCFARSLPKASLDWQLSGSLLSTSSLPSITTDTVTIHYIYTAQKDDNGKRLTCTGVYDLVTFSDYALINVLYRPIVTVSPNNSPFRVIENTTNLLLTCIVTDANPAVTSYTWKKDDSMVHGTAIYTIPTVHRSQAGSYTCEATNSVNTSNPSSAIKLEILYGPEIIPISKKKPHEGTRLHIICNVQSFPPITDNDVTWTKQDNATFSMKGKILVIDNVNRLDSGTYVCSVVIKLLPNVGQPMNITGRTNAEVDVLYSPTVSIYPNDSLYKVIENTTNLVLVCTVTVANPAVTSYRWFKDGSLIDGSTDASYNISKVQRDHTGRYTCDATNIVGSSNLSSAVHLNVLYGVEINLVNRKELTQLAQLNISCNVKSNPEVTTNDVTWTKQNNATFRRTGEQLVIEATNRIDSGTYICSVVIKLKPTSGPSINVTGTATVEVIVLYRPTVTVSPDHNQYNVIENTTNLQLKCIVTDANPAVTSYRWFKGSSVISNAATYNISTVQRSHKGNYTCKAVNTVGTSAPSSVVHLYVLYGVELYPIKKKVTTEGNNLTITCSGQSYPTITTNEVKWSKQNNNTFSRKGFQLVVNNVNRLDTGTYICSAVLQLTPTVGQPLNVTGTTTVLVDVLFRPDVTVSPDKNPYSVIENTTNVQLMCNATNANPAATSYSWYKDGDTVSTGPTYTVSTVYRSHTGSYTCDAENSVGKSDPSSIVQLNVLYGVSLKLSGAEISINESERWELSCIGDGNPLPIITWVYEYNRTTVSEQKVNATSITVDHANCVDTGLYMCSGNNTIGEPVSRSTDVKVACKPRTYNNIDTKNIFISGTDETLNISTIFISFPLSNISWSRKLPDGNLTDLNSEFIHFTNKSHLPYETISILQKVQLKQDDFGIYVVKASNIHGSFVLRYDVIAKRSPDAPTNITASCDVTSIKVTWISRFNGGENQLFRIKLVNMKTNNTIFKEDIDDKGQDEIINQEIQFLSPDTLYLISLEATNVIDTTNSLEIANCTTQTNQEDNQSVSSAVVGGITGSISALLLVIIVTGGFYLWRRRHVPDVTKELINSSKETDEDEEGLKANPLYVTSGETANAEVGPVYGVVNKKKKNQQNLTFTENNDQGPVYSEVHKPNIQGKKKQAQKKAKKDPKNDNCKDIELGTVYENSDKLFKNKYSDELYANAGEQGNDVNSSKVYCPKKNKDGLIYADLDLIPGPSGKKFVIRGLENRTNYAIIDLSIKVDPLPSDDEDEDKENENKNLPMNESKE